MPQPSPHRPTSGQCRRAAPKRRGWRNPGPKAPRSSELQGWPQRHSWDPLRESWSHRPLWRARRFRGLTKCPERSQAPRPSVRPPRPSEGTANGHRPRRENSAARGGRPCRPLLHRQALPAFEHKVGPPERLWGWRPPTVPPCAGQNPPRTTACRRCGGTTRHSCSGPRPARQSQ